MIDWVHKMWLDWGIEMRRHYKGWPSNNHIWRIYLAQGISSDDFGPRNPNVEFGSSADVEQINDIFHTMPEEWQVFTWIFYVKRWGKEKKAKELGMSITKMYEMRSQIHSYTVGRLDNLSPDLIDRRQRAI